MWFTDTLIATAAAPLLLMVGGGLLGRRTGRRRVADRLDRLHTDMVAWQARHGDKVRSLERQVAEIERSVARAEHDARTASRRMSELSGPLVQRLERLEHHSEITILTTQGASPPG